MRASASASVLVAGCLVSGCGDDGGSAEVETHVERCFVEEYGAQLRSPVAEVRVVNRSDDDRRFDVVVQFRVGHTVLGEGEEYTSVLRPGDQETISMGLMSGAADDVDECVVLSVEEM